MLSDKILVVDDNPRVVTGVKLALDEYEVIGLHRGEEAIKYLRKPNEIRLVLLDICMPDVDGISVLNEIRKMNRDIGVIIMTAFGSMDVAIQALRSRADDFIEKPFNIEELREKIKVLLKERSSLIKRKKHNDSKVERIKRFIERNYTNVSLEAIANEICLSSKYVSRMFNKKSDSSFREYKVKVKIDVAKSLLKNSSLTVQEVSYKLGYMNPESFMRIFKRKTKLTPSQYREKFVR